MDRSQKLINPFVSETKEFACICIYICITVVIDIFMAIQQDASTLGQSGPGSDGNEGVLRIPQSSGITGNSSWNCLVSYQDIRCRGLTPLHRSGRYILQTQPTGSTDSTDNRFTDYIITIIII